MITTLIGLLVGLFLGLIPLLALLLIEHRVAKIRQAVDRMEEILRMTHDANQETLEVLKARLPDPEG